MRIVVVVIICSLLAMVIQACGGAESFPTEGTFRQRAEAASEAASSASLREYPFEAYRDVYKFMAPEFRKKCNRNEFASQAFNRLRHISSEARLGPDYISVLLFQVTKVTVSGTEGLVELKVSHKGNPTRLGGGWGHGPDQWVFTDGKWWIKSSRYWITDKERESGGCEIIVDWVFTGS